MATNLFETPTTGINLDSVDYWFNSEDDGKPCVLVFFPSGRSVILRGQTMSRFKEEYRSYKSLQFQVLKKMLRETTIDIFGAN